MYSRLIRFSSSSGRRAKEVPRNGKRGLNGPVVVALRDELLLEPVGKLQVLLVQFRQGFLPDNRNEPAEVAAVRVTGIELVGHTPVVLPGLPRPDPEVHEPGEAGQGIHRRVGTPAEEVAGEHDLPLGDVARQVGDRVGDIVVGHGQDRDLGDGPLPAFQPPRPLVDGREVGVHVAGIAPPAGHLFAGGGDLAECLAVVDHVRQDHEHVEVVGEREELCYRKAAPRGGEPFHGRVVGKVHEEDHAVERPCPLEVPGKERGLLVGDAHRNKDHRKLLPLAQHLRLPGNLGSELACRESRTGEDRQFLAADQRVEPVDGRHAGLDEVGRLVAGRGIDRHARDVQHRLGDDVRPAVPGFSHPGKDPAQHVERDIDPGRLPHEPDRGRFRIDPPRALEDLDDRMLFRDIEHLAGPLLAVAEPDLHHLAIRGALYVLDKNKGARDVVDCPVFPGDKSSVLHFSTPRPAICCRLSPIMVRMTSMSCRSFILPMPALSGRLWICRSETPRAIASLTFS